jgi:hypothetical protein
MRSGQTATCKDLYSFFLTQPGNLSTAPGYFSANFQAETGKGRENTATSKLVNSVSSLTCR